MLKVGESYIEKLKFHSIKKLTDINGKDIGCTLVSTNIQLTKHALRVSLVK